MVKLCINCRYSLRRERLYADGPRFDCRREETLEIDPVTGREERRGLRNCVRERASDWSMRGFGKTCGPDARFFVKRPPASPPNQGSGGSKPLPRPTK